MKLLIFSQITRSFHKVHKELISATVRLMEIDEMLVDRLS